MDATCPICRARVTAQRPENPNFPFCSARCRTIDLGRWLGGAYGIPVTDEAPSESDLAEAPSRKES